MDINELITDDELEECIDGCSDIRMIRGIITQVQDVHINEEAFATIFAQNISGFIAEEEGTDEWDEANQNNWEWGYVIAENINDLIKGKKK